jgi:hypothetical protein
MIPKIVLVLDRALQNIPHVSLLLVTDAESIGAGGRDSPEHGLVALARAGFNRVVDVSTAMSMEFID